MALAINVAYKFKLNVLKKLVSDLSNSSSDIKVALVTTLPNYTTIDNYSEITEVNPAGASGVGYTTGGKSITNKVVSLTGGTVMFDGDDALWADSSITAVGAVIYDNTPADNALKKVIAVADFGGSMSDSAGTFKLQWNAAGIFNLT